MKRSKNKAVRDMIRLIEKHGLEYDELHYVFRTAKQEIGIQPPKRQKKEAVVWAFDEVERLKKLIPDIFPNTTQIVIGLIIDIINASGPRIASLLNAKICDLDLNAAKLRLTKTKRDKPYTLPIPAPVADKLRIYLSGRHPAQVFLFEKTANCLPTGPYTVRAIEKMFNKIAAAAGEKYGRDFSGFTPHSLRHSASTEYALLGMDVRHIATLNNHSQTTTTERNYIHGNVDYLKREMDKKYIERMTS